MRKDCLWVDEGLRMMKDLFHCVKQTFYLRFMDHTPKRVILFDKKASPANPPPTKKDGKLANEERKTSEKPKKPVETSPLALIEWLDAHDLIKIRALCIKADIDPGTFHRWMNVSKEIPPHALEKITPILKDYGFESGL